MMLNFCNCQQLYTCTCSTATNTSTNLLLLAATQYYIRKSGLMLQIEQCGLSVCVCHSNEPCKNGSTDQDAVWVEDSGGPKEASVTWGCILAPPGEYD